MTNSLRVFAWFVALSAIMLRAALPAGWMPVADISGGTRLVICTGHGPLATPVQSQKRAPLPGHSNDICPFAAVVQLAPPGNFAVLPTPDLNSWELRQTTYNRTIFPERAYGNYTPRAPPRFA